MPCARRHNGSQVMNEVSHGHANQCLCPPKSVCAPKDWAWCQFSALTLSNLEKSVRLSKWTLFKASEALEINSQRKMLLLEEKVLMMRNMSWTICAWKAEVSTSSSPWASSQESWVAVQSRVDLSYIWPACQAQAAQAYSGACFHFWQEHLFVNLKF